MKPIIYAEAQDYIDPLLHLFNGLVNKVWTSLLFYLDQLVEHISAHKSNLNSFGNDQNFGSI